MSSSAARAAPVRTVLVDDNADLRALLKLLLGRDERFAVIGEAADGRQAIERAEDLQPELVVLDVTMPGLSGLGALPRLRQVAPAARVVMLSAHPAEDMEQASLAGGAVGYIEKSLDLTTLPDQLHALTAVLDAVQQVLDETYDPDPLAPRRARADLRSALAAQADPDAIDVVELLTSELVTNAVEHAGSPARVAAAVLGARIRVSVSDDDPTPLQVATPAAGAEGGRGLALVEALSLSWGIDVTPSGKTVWFEIRA